MILDFFAPYEFRCRCGRCGLGYPDMDVPFVERLTVARWHAGVPFVLSSAIRCREHNEAVGGVEDSSHPKGFAVDIQTPDDHIRYQVVSGLIKAGFTRIGIYGWGVHVDADPSKMENRIWHG